MKKLFFAIAVIATFASCKKESVETGTVAPVPQQNVPQANAANKLKVKISSVFGIETGDYNFDVSGRILSSVQVINGITRVHSFDYATPGKIYVTIKDDGVIKRTLNCDVNLKGNVVKLIDFNADGSIYQTSIYTYDANDYLIKCDWVTAANNVSGRYEYVITNGNITEDKTYFSNNLQRTSTYTYDLSKNNKQDYGPGSYFRGKSFGLSSKNLPIKWKTVSASGTIMRDVDYLNQFDASGTLVKRTYFDAVGTFTQEETYSNQ